MEIDASKLLYRYLPPLEGVPMEDRLNLEGTIRVAIGKVCNDFRVELSEKVLADLVSEVLVQQQSGKALAVNRPMLAAKLDAKIMLASSKRTA